MPNWDLNDLMSRATRAVGRRADIEPSTASFWANQAYFEVTEMAPHALQERIAVSSTTSGENKIQLPPDFSELVSISYLSGHGSRRTLRQMNPHEHDGGFHPRTLGLPERYVLFNDWLELWPSPNSAYSLQLRYYSDATDMVASSDIPSVSTPWRKAVYLKTKELLFSEHMGDFDRAALARNDFHDYVNSIPDDRARRFRGDQEAAVRLIYTRPRK